MTTLPSGLSSSPAPLFAFAVLVGVGAAVADPGALDVMLVGQKTGAGTATGNVATQVFDATDAEARFGARSRLAMMVRAFRAIAPRATLYACPIADPGGATAATARLDFAGPATGAGVLLSPLGSVVMVETSVVSVSRRGAIRTMRA